MDQKNDYRTPRDRITGEFLSELFLGEDMEKTVTVSSGVYNTCSPRPQNDFRRNTCGCSTVVPRGNVTIEGNYSLAMAYIPWQNFEDLFCEEEGFSQGTIFKKLRFPFYPTPCRKEGDCQ